MNSGASKKRYALTQAMKKFFKIRIEFFYIAFFQAIGWLLSGNKMEIHRGQFGLMKAKGFPQPAPIPITLHGVAIFCGNGKSQAWIAQLILRIVKNPVAGDPLLRVLTKFMEVGSFPDAAGGGKTKFLPLRSRLTWNQSLPTNSCGPFYGERQVLCGHFSFSCACDSHGFSRAFSYWAAKGVS